MFRGVSNSKKMVAPGTKCLTGPPTAEALLYAVFQLQNKIRRSRTTRMWYRT